MSKFIGIVGTRTRDTFEDFLQVTLVFNQLYRPGDIIVSGGCKQGGDRFAEILALATNKAPVLFLPDRKSLDPELLKTNPRAAWAQVNNARNILIAQKSEQLIACVSPERRGGTEHTIKYFERFHLGRRAIII